MRIKLWSINRWLRYTGMRLFVEVDIEKRIEPTRIGLAWYGWSFLGGHHE